MKRFAWTSALWLVAWPGCAQNANAPGVSPADSSAPEARTDGPKTEPPRPNGRASGTQMANPAAVHCLERGGKIEMRKDASGQYGVCVFADGSRCEAWRFFRGQCAPGQCRQPSGICKQKK